MIITGLNKFKLPSLGDLVHVVTRVAWLGPTVHDITGLLLHHDITMSSIAAYGHLIILDGDGNERNIAFRTYDGDTLDVMSSLADVE